MKLCCSCQTVKEVSLHFHKSSSSKDGRNAYCKPCQANYQRNYYKRPYVAAKNRKRCSSAVGKALALKSRLKLAFGLSLEDYKQLLYKQNNVCAICERPDPRQRLSVDHSHITGKVRGLLCGNCNRSLGLIKDNLRTSIKMVGYILQDKEDTDGN